MSIKTKPAGINAERLKSFVERIEKLEEERQALGGDLRDVYSEAKGVGYDVKTMRKIVSLRKQDAADRDEQNTLLDVYKHALGMDTGGQVVKVLPTEDELVDVASRVIGEVDRCMEILRGNKPPKIVAIRELFGCSLGKAAKLRALVEKRLADEISRSNAIQRENLPHTPDGVVIEREDDGSLTSVEQTAAPLVSAVLCSCEKCCDLRAGAMVVSGAPVEQTFPGPGFPGWSYGCAKCGNKRCPHHTNHKLACTNSNDPGQPGSSYHRIEAEPPAVVGAVAEPKAERVATPFHDDEFEASRLRWETIRTRALA